MSSYFDEPNMLGHACIVPVIERHSRCVLSSRSMEGIKLIRFEQRHKHKQTHKPWTNIFNTSKGPSLTGVPALLAFPGGPHRRSQSDVPDYAGVEGGDDPFGDLSDGLPQKYATLPRNHNPNPFQGGGAAAWEPGAERQKKEKVSLLERVTGKKDARKAANGARTGSTSDLRVANPFSADVQFTNPFKSRYRTRTADLTHGVETPNPGCLTLTLI